MPDRVYLYYRDRWLNEPFKVYENEPLNAIYRYDFQLNTFEEGQLKYLRVNDKLFHTFDEEQAFQFSLSSSKPLLTIIIDYEKNGELFHKRYTIETERSMLPSQDYLDSLQKQYNKWKERFIEVADVFETDEIELADFYGKTNWQSTYKNFKNRLNPDHNDAIWFYTLRQEITAHLQRILRKPKVKLESKELLVNAAELDIITPRTIQHFMKDTTTWAKSTLQRPVPEKLLKEVHEESINVYENRFIYTFAFHLEKEIRFTIKELKDHLHTIENKMNSNFMQIDLDILQVEAEFENIELHEYRELFNSVLNQLKKMHNLTRHTMKTFKELKKIQGYISPNQVLLYNKDYGTLYRYYNNYMKMDNPKQKKLNDSIDYQLYYTDEVFLNVIINLLELGFESTAPIIFKMSSQLESSIFSKEEIAFTFKHPKLKVEITVIRQPCDARGSGNFEIVLQFHSVEQGEDVIVKILPTLVQFQKAVSLHEIQRLYEYPTNFSTDILIARKKSEQSVPGKPDSVFIVYPSNSKEDYNKKMTYEQLHLVYTLGTNFIDSAKFREYGSMKYGAFPFNSEGVGKSIFKRLIRLQLFKFGIRSHCFMCGEEGLRKSGSPDEEYICSGHQCGCEWGVRTCSCGSPIYKMQKKSKKADEHITEEMQQHLLEKSDVDWLFDKENTNSTMGLANLCENGHLGTSFFTVCSNCGDCRQQSKQGRICRRCDAIDKCRSLASL